MPGVAFRTLGESHRSSDCGRSDAVAERREIWKGTTRDVSWIIRARVGIKVDVEDINSEFGMRYSGLHSVRSDLP